MSHPEDKSRIEAAKFKEKKLIDSLYNIPPLKDSTDFFSNLTSEEQALVDAIENAEPTPLELEQIAQREKQRIRTNPRKARFFFNPKSVLQEWFRKRRSLPNDNPPPPIDLNSKR